MITSEVNSKRLSSPKALLFFLILFRRDDGRTRVSTENLFVATSKEISHMSTIFNEKIFSVSLAATTYFVDSSAQSCKSFPLPHNLTIINIVQGWPDFFTYGPNFIKIFFLGCFS